ncbi:MAG: acyl-CoA dehydratase activase-related protein, partial [Christensenellales bacterium]
VFHGHVAWLKDKCDYILIPRFMNIEKKKYICPMFCGLIEMIISSIPHIPPLIDCAVYSLEKDKLFAWSKRAGSIVIANSTKLHYAFKKALDKQRFYHPGFHNIRFPFKVALIGHTYNIHDGFMNMNLIKKLNHLGIGVITSEYVNREDIERQTCKLFKQPFWYFARQYYGAAVHLYASKKIDGIVYISAFSCGVDSVVIELIKNATRDFPLMVLKIDEHTGEAGFDTRVEAFADMLKRRTLIDRHNSPHGKHVLGSQDIV